MVSGLPRQADYSIASPRNLSLRRARLDKQQSRVIRNRPPARRRGVALARRWKIFAKMAVSMGADAALGSLVLLVILPEATRGFPFIPHHQRTRLDHR